jgi:hypothetical protein
MNRSFLPFFSTRRVSKSNDINNLRFSIKPLCHIIRTVVNNLCFIFRILPKNNKSNKEFIEYVFYICLSYIKKTGSLPKIPKRVGIIKKI